MQNVAPASSITLPWLVRLRWGAVGGQLLTVAVATVALGLELPVAALSAVVLLTAATNLALWRRMRREPAPAAPLIAWVLVLDTLLLTALLSLAGGPANPFSVLYLVHVTMAVVVVGTQWALAVVALACACFGFLFLIHVPLLEVTGAASLAWALHLRGMWFAFVVAAAVIAYFVGRVSAELRSREGELAEVQAQMARNEKLSSLTTLAAGAAHELGSPLATIAVVAKELERAAGRIPDAGPIVEDARLIRQQVERCRVILRQMSAQAGQTSGELPGPVEVAALLADVRETLSAEQAAGLRVSDDGTQIVVAPVQALVLVMATLLRNAFDAAGASGRVSLRIETRGAFVRLAVHDDGPGMAPEVLAKAGDPFFSTKPPGAGMGLGLFLARAFAERLGGRLELVSTPGYGTTAAVELPVPMPQKEVA